MTPVIIDRALNRRRGRVISWSACSVLVQWLDRDGVQSIPVAKFTSDRYELEVAP